MPVITVENIGKKYNIRHKQKEDTLYGTLANLFKKTASSNKSEEFWALKNISFDVEQGDRVGIIGRNGAGKSTLLKILSRITEPTTGRIKIQGRVASLLEVGTGFHPELTGRENIFLNGAILGMGKSEIKRKFDEIVAFSEIEKFLDTPVKRYSSGMYVRLAFAVAAHLEPEILIIDEVLAVGDIQFQKKCLGKMRDVGEEGRTILFVSHNISAIQNLCNIGILIDKGELIKQTNIGECINEYFNNSSKTKSTYQIKSADNSLTLTNIFFLDKNQRKTSISISGEDLFIVIRIEASKPYNDIVCTMGINNSQYARVSLITNKLLNTTSLKKGVNHLVCHLKNIPLAGGEFWIDAFKIFDTKNNVLIYERNLTAFTMTDAKYNPYKQYAGYINLQQHWYSSQDTSFIKE